MTCILGSHIVEWGLVQCSLSTWGYGFNWWDRHIFSASPLLGSCFSQIPLHWESVSLGTLEDSGPVQIFYCVAFQTTVLGCWMEWCPHGSARLNFFGVLLLFIFVASENFLYFSSQLSHAFDFILIHYLYTLCYKTFWCLVLSMVGNRGLFWIFFSN